MRRSLSLLAIALSVVFGGSRSLASTLTVTESGTFSANTPVTAVSAPGDTFSYTFMVSSTPTVSAVSLSNSFDPVISNFSYTLNGVASFPAIGSATVFNFANDAGLFDICFTAACSSDGMIPDLGFQFTGSQQIYTGSEASPTIVTGTYAPLDFYFADEGQYSRLSSASSIVIASTPEPSSVALFGSGLLVAARYLRRRRT